MIDPCKRHEFFQARLVGVARLQGVDVGKPGQRRRQVCHRPRTLLDPERPRLGRNAAETYTDEYKPFILNDQMRCFELAIVLFL